jgi:hypothetical protein
MEYQGAFHEERRRQANAMTGEKEIGEFFEDSCSQSAGLLFSNNIFRM